MCFCVMCQWNNNPVLAKVQVTENGGRKATLGKRILRAETAPLVALTLIMYETDNME